MALSAAVVGRVDLPASMVGAAGSPVDLTAIVCDLTLGVNGDYTSGIALSAIVTAINASGVVPVEINAVIWCQIVSVNRGGGSRFGYTVLDLTAGKVRWIEVITNETTIGTEYGTGTGTANDVFRMFVVGV